MVKKVEKCQCDIESFNLVQDIRRRLRIKYPDVDESADNEHPMTAVGIVLVSAAVLGTTEIGRLITFTGYSSEFISAIEFNMQQNKLWVNNRYDEEECSKWLSPARVIHNDDVFWDHICIACGDLWMPNVDSTVSADPCSVYWDERPTQSPRNRTLF
jgi:hypothetical protein